MLTILHISDLHFGPPYRAEVGETLLRDAARLNADIIVASGDFTQRAKPEQFATARQFLERLPPAPLVVVPGNHDIPLYRIYERLVSPYALYRQHIRDELDYVLRLPGAVIVALNTTNPLRAITSGRVTQRQLDLCSQAFRDAPADAAKIIVAHHHFAAAPDFDHDGKAMHGGRAALERFTQLGVDLILGGHLHRAYLGNSLDVHSLVDPHGGIPIVQCGTSTSSRGRAREHEQNSFQWIEIELDVVRITPHLYFPTLGRFAPVAQHILPRRGKQMLGL